MHARTRCCRRCDEVDAILMTGYFGGYSSGEDGLTGLGPAECAAAKQIAADAAGDKLTYKPTAVQSIFPDAPACRILADGGVPVFAAIEDAAAALAAVAVPARTATMLPLPAAARTGRRDRLHRGPKCIRRRGDPFRRGPRGAHPPRNWRSPPMSFGRRMC